MNISVSIQKIYTFNVGGKDFSFSRDTLQSSGKNFLKGQWKEAEKHFIDASPKIFEKWIVPYIRYSILPDLESIKDGQEKQHIVAVANRVCLVAIANHIAPPVKYPKGTFGPAEYEHYYGIKVEDVPPVPKEFLKILNGLCPIFKGKQAVDTHMLYLVVEGLNLNAMEKHAKNPVNGHKTEKGFEFFYIDIREKYGNQKVQKTYWVLKTKGLLPDSVDKPREKLLAIAAKDGYEAPSILEEVVGELTWYVRTGKRLMSKDENAGWIFTFTCCREEPIDGFKIIVGGFIPAGPSIYCDSYNNGVGVAGVMRQKS